MKPSQPASPAPGQPAAQSARSGGRWLARALRQLCAGRGERTQPLAAQLWDGSERRRARQQQAPASPRADADAVLAVAQRMLRDHRAPAPDAVAQTLCELLSALLNARVVYVALPVASSPWLCFVASAGPAAAWLEQVRVSGRADLPEGRGAAGTALRSGRVQHWASADQRFGPWSAGARRQGIGGVLACAARTGEGQAIVLGLLHAEPSKPSLRLGEVLQQLVDELAARHWRGAAPPQRVLSHEAWLSASRRDPRTGLLNRRTLLARLERLLAAPVQPPGMPALCLLELEALAEVRARWGRDAAESVYYACAMRLRESLSDVARVARAGRAGFALLFEPVASSQQAEWLAARALAAVGAPVAGAGCTAAACCGLDVRVGLALAVAGRDSARATWRAARLSLQRACTCSAPAAPAAR